MTIAIALTVLLCLCVAPLILANSRQGRRHKQEKYSKLQPDTFVCCHCAARKPVSQLSTEINRMCQVCAELYETIQDEP